MLRDRLLVSLLFIPLVIFVIIAGGRWLTATLLIISALAVREYAQLFRQKNFRPIPILMIAGVLAIDLARHFSGFAHDSWLVLVVVMLAVSLHLLDYERGRDEAPLDFAVTLSGIVYIGLLGSYMLTLRALPQGSWWLLLTLFSVWLADSGAYFIGTRYGKHKMTRRLSPNKSWQGYFGGIAVAIVGAPLFLLLFRQFGAPEGDGLTMANAAILGFFISLLTILGDLTASMIKRYVGVKDSSQLFPGHGGMLDRMDSWLWAFPIGYYLVSVFFQ